METLALTPDVLRVLAEGLDRLSDGDLDDRRLVDLMDTHLENMGIFRRGNAAWVGSPEEIRRLNLMRDGWTPTFPPEGVVDGDGVFFYPRTADCSQCGNHDLVWSVEEARGNMSLKPLCRKCSEEV